MIAAYGGEQSSHAQDSGEKEGSQDHGPTPRRAPIGPAMPSQAMLAQAQKAAIEYVQEVRHWSCHCRVVWGISCYDFLWFKGVFDSPLFSPANEVMLHAISLLGGRATCSPSLDGPFVVLSIRTLLLVRMKMILGRLSPARRNALHQSGTCVVVNFLVLAPAAYRQRWQNATRLTHQRFLPKFVPTMPFPPCAFAS